jgi:hypothetical protein
MRFEAVNESGIVERLTEKGQFRFVYESNFYGSCTFVAAVSLCEQKSLVLQEDSLVIEDYEVKRGEIGSLQKVSLTFFRRILSKDPGQFLSRSGLSGNRLTSPLGQPAIFEGGVSGGE